MQLKTNQQHAADIYTARFHSAVITNTDHQQTTVQYLPEVVRAKNTQVQIAASLPIRDEPYSHPWGQLPPFLVGLLPEGQRLSALRRHLKVSLDNELALLLAGGSDPVGDVFVLPPGQTPKLELVSKNQVLDFEQLLETAYLDPGFLAGVQPKVSHHMLTLPTTHLKQPVLAKLPSQEYPELIRNEYLLIKETQKAFRGLHIPVVAAELVTDIHGHAGLLVKRFDRVTTNQQITSLAVEDGAQILGIYPAAKYEPTTEALILAMSRQTVAPIVATRNLFAQFVWAFLSGNGDAHAKNFSVVGRGSSRTIAPAYDLPCTLVFGDNTMALSIAGQHKKIRLRHFLDLAAAVGLPLAVAEKIIAHLIAAAKNLPTLITELYPTSSGNAAARELRDRAYRIS